MSELELCLSWSFDVLPMHGAEVVGLVMPEGLCRCRKAD